MIDSERRESRIRIPARGNGVTSLGGHPPRFLRVLYEGVKISHLWRTKRLQLGVREPDVEGRLPMTE